MDIAEIEKILGYTFKEKALLVMAFTHSTYANEKGVSSYERLEFLGDALVDFVTAERFYHDNPNFSEGKLTAIRKKAVCRDALSEAKDMDKLVGFIRLSKNLAINPKIRADLFESIVAAIYLDAGFERAREFVLSKLDIKVESLDKKREDYKSQLLELAGKMKFTVEFKEIEEFGPEHAKTYVYSVEVNGKEFSLSQGTSKKRAEQSAAKIAIQRLLNSKKY